MITETQKQVLCQKAKEASELSYSPYSCFPVGAAVLTKSGEIYTGANVENASFGLTICAERVALVKAVSEGHNEFQAITVYAKKSNSTSPCGACRQFIIEFGEDIEVFYYNNANLICALSAELLPNSFSGKEL